MRLREKLLGNKPPNTFKRMAWGTNVSANIIATATTNSMTTNRRAVRWRYSERSYASKPLLRNAPTAMLTNTNHTNKGEAKLEAKEPKNQRMPSALVSEREKSSGIAAVNNHDTNTTKACATHSPKAKYGKTLSLLTAQKLLSILRLPANCLCRGCATRTPSPPVGWH